MTNTPSSPVRLWQLKQALDLPTIQPGANWMDHLKTLWDGYGRNASIGAGAGALLAGSASAMSHGSAGESPGERRRRILRDALVGGTFGAGAGVALPASAEAFNTASPPESHLDKKVEDLAGQFHPDKTLGGLSGAGLLGGATYARNWWNRGQATLADFKTNLAAKADSWKSQWEAANMANQKFLNDERSRMWGVGEKMVPRRDVPSGTMHKGKPVMRPQTPQERTVDIERYRDDLFNRTHGADLDGLELQHQLGNIKGLRSDWGNLKLPDATGKPVSIQRMFQDMQAAHPGVAPAQLEDAFHRQLLQKIKAHIATNGSDIVRQMSATGRMGSPSAYTGTTLTRAPRPSMGAGGWAKVLAMGALPTLIPPAARTLAYLKNTYDASAQ